MEVVKKFDGVYSNDRMFLVIEEPGDCTRYNHIIHIHGNYVSCVGYKFDSGAILKQEITIDRFTLFNPALNLIGIESHMAVRKVSDNYYNYQLNEEHSKDNLFTVASAIRCMQTIAQSVHEIDQGTGKLKVGFNTVHIKGCKDEAKKFNV